MAIKSNPDVRWQHLKRVEQTFLDPTAANSGAPNGGWIACVRTALGMSRQQLGERLGISRSSVRKLEEREVAKSVSLEALERAAAALDCRLEYRVIPLSGTLETTVSQRAVRVAAESLKSPSSAVEGGNSEAAIMESLAIATRRLLATWPRGLWNDARRETFGANVSDSPTVSPSPPSPVPQTSSESSTREPTLIERSRPKAVSPSLQLDVFGSSGAD